MQSSYLIILLADFFTLLNVLYLLGVAVLDERFRWWCLALEVDVD